MSKPRMKTKNAKPMTPEEVAAIDIRDLERHEMVDYGAALGAAAARRAARAPLPHLSTRVARGPPLAASRRGQGLGVVLRAFPACRRAGDKLRLPGVGDSPAETPEAAAEVRARLKRQQRQATVLFGYLHARRTEAPSVLLTPRRAYAADGRRSRGS